METKFRLRVLTDGGQVLRVSIRGYVERQNVEADQTCILLYPKFVARFSIDEDFLQYFSLILSHAPPCEQQARLGRIQGDKSKLFAIYTKHNIDTR